MQVPFRIRSCSPGRRCPLLLPIRYFLGDTHSLLCVCAQILGIPPPTGDLEKPPDCKSCRAGSPHLQGHPFSPYSFHRRQTRPGCPELGMWPPSLAPAWVGTLRSSYAVPGGRAQPPGWAAGRGPGPLWNPLLIPSSPVSTPDQTIPLRSLCPSCLPPQSAAVRGDAVSGGVRSCVLCARL